MKPYVHRRTLQKQRSFLIVITAQSLFVSKQYLNNHVSTEHAEEAGVCEKRHHCNTCGRDYANSLSLRQHKCHPQGEKRKRRPKNSQVSE